MKAPEIVSTVLVKMASHVSPGISTQQLDAIGERELKRLGGKSYNKGYKPVWAKEAFPNVTCISVNDEIAHGLPRETNILKEGDIVNLDLGVIDSEGNCGDAGMSIPVGKISDQDEMLLHYAKKTLYAGIDKVKNGCTVYDIANAMERTAMQRNLLINYQLCGHGIGKHMHEDPYIYQVTNHNEAKEEEYLKYEKHMNIVLKTGMIICLEPCVTNGKDRWGFVEPGNGWVFRTRDGKKSAMFEHMLKVTDDGCEILTTHFERFKI